MEDGVWCDSASEGRTLTGPSCEVGDSAGFSFDSGCGVVSSSLEIGGLSSTVVRPGISPWLPSVVQLLEGSVLEVKLRSAEEAERLEDDENEDDLHEVVKPPPVLQVDDFKLLLIEDKELLPLFEVGLVGFWDGSDVVVPLTSSEAAVSALDDETVVVYSPLEIAKVLMASCSCSKT